MAFSNVTVDAPTSTIVVCGAGTMGSGIALLCAQAGFHTVLFDSMPEQLHKGFARIRQHLDALIEKDKISGVQASQSLQRIVCADSVSACKGDLVIEAIIEDLDIKKELLSRLSSLNDPQTVIASNTSSLSIKALSAAVSSPERFIGLHFFNPPAVMKLVEVVKLGITADAVLHRVLSFVSSLGKLPVVCNDAPGFIVNRVARPFYLESLHLMEKYGLSPNEMDLLVEAAGFKMGPCRLMDLIGNDINFTVSKSIFEQLGSPVRFTPSSLQYQMVQEGKLGKKTRKGFYVYE